MFDLQFLFYLFFKFHNSIAPRRNLAKITIDAERKKKHLCYNLKKKNKDIDISNNQLKVYLKKRGKMLSKLEKVAFLIKKIIFIHVKCLEIFDIL